MLFTRQTASIWPNKQWKWIFKALGCIMKRCLCWLREVITGGVFLAQPRICPLWRAHQLRAPGCYRDPLKMHRATSECWSHIMQLTCCAWAASVMRRSFQRCFTPLWLYVTPVCLAAEGPHALSAPEIEAELFTNVKYFSVINCQTCAPAVSIFRVSLYR